MPAITAMVETYLPVMVTAGDYARRIQPRIAGPARKAGQNPWVQAITDADQSVQTFFEVTTLARFPANGSKSSRRLPHELNTSWSWSTPRRVRRRCRSNISRKRRQSLASSCGVMT